MKCRLIVRRVEFNYDVHDVKDGSRYWYVSKYLHRDDGGPACEYMSDGYCSWHEHGKFIRNNR